MAVEMAAEGEVLLAAVGAGKGGVAEDYGGEGFFGRQRAGDDNAPSGFVGWCAEGVESAGAGGEQSCGNVVGAKDADGGVYGEAFPNAAGGRARCQAR